jgi:glycine/D-amino acid oxidase-like deaminating enzyme
MSRESPVLRHDPTGYWLVEAGERPVATSLSGDERADVVVVGGGYAGLWTAWALHENAPDARVVVLEADRCGFGPSGRNAGFLNSLWHRIDRFAASVGDRAARDLCVETGRSVDRIGEWAEERGIDIWFRRAGHLKVATSAAQEGRWNAALETCARLGAGDELRALDEGGVAAICRSPLFGTGAIVPQSATVQPARLALGLRDALLDAGTTIHERTRARRIRPTPGGVVVEADEGRVEAEQAVVAINAAAAGFGPLRNRLVVTATHMIVTEPVPDVLEEVGWTGGESISTARSYLHYMRTTPDGRIAIGSGGGRLAYGARLGGRIEVDRAAVAELIADLVELFPPLRGRRIEHAWGGPIDISASPFPVIGTLPDGRTHYIYGFAGNGVGPAHLSGRILAGLAFDRRDELTSLALVEPPAAPVPPEPLRYLGGNAVRAAIMRKDRLEDAGMEADPLTRLLIDVPDRLGIHVG